MRSIGLIIGLFLCMVGASGAFHVQAQSFRHAGTEFRALRRMLVPEDKTLEVGVAAFHHEGLVNDEGTNVLVVTADRKVVPTRVLQRGPGDFCRVAFQTDGQQREYMLFYGGAAPSVDDVPKWTSQAGLLLETREYRQCNLNSFESVKQAFENSSRIGSGYVRAVNQGSNPYTLTPGPFLSRFTGTLHIATAGNYGFLTSSQDCSFLLVDGKVVVSSPGRHGPQRRARRGTRKDVRLESGSHVFEYYHAASGPNAMMVAAWEVNPKSDKPAPAPIPAEVFGADSVGAVLVGSRETQKEKLLPDFKFAITGSVPLPDNPRHLLGVRFENTTAPALLTKSKVAWDFGDGQTSDQPNPEHVFLQPGMYPVRLAIQRGVKKLETTYTIEVDQRRDRPRDLPDLDRYLPILETYDVAKLDAFSLQQLVSAFLWKAELTISPKGGNATVAADGSALEPNEEARLALEREAAARDFFLQAVNTAKVGLLGDSAAKGDEELFELVQISGPIARDRVGDSRLAGQLWQGAAQRISRSDLRAQCELAAADIALNDLVNPGYAKGLLDRTTAAIGQAETGNIVSELHRLWGDYYAATGDGAQARKHYSDAAQSRETTRNHAEQTAWRGAYSRSAEHFLKYRLSSRAAEQLRTWQDEFPADKLDGYMQLLFARYWMGRGNYAATVAQADQVLVVNPASPYADRLLALAAEAEEKRERIDRALATLQSLVHDYPGSPLFSHAQTQIRRLEAKLQK